MGKTEKPEWYTESAVVDQLLMLTQAGKKVFTKIYITAC